MAWGLCFNPSRGIAIIQTPAQLPRWLPSSCFNPSRGIAIIQTGLPALEREYRFEFQSLTRDSNHSNEATMAALDEEQMFQSLTRDSNHSNCATHGARWCFGAFQSLTRDSNHSNKARRVDPPLDRGFNPSRGIAIIQTAAHDVGMKRLRSFNPSRGIAIIQT